MLQIDIHPIKQFQSSIINIQILSMKLYSQIHKNTDYQEPKQVSFNTNTQPMNSQALRNMPNTNELLGNNSKFSFRLQPQKHFKKDNQHLSALFNVPAHIKVNEEQSVEKQTKSKSKRKKIFEKKVPVFRLKDEDQVKIMIHNREQNSILPVAQQKMKNLDKDNMNQSRMQNSFKQGSISKSFNMDQNRYKTYKPVNFTEDYQREKINKLLTQPILTTTDQKNNKKHVQPQRIQELLKHFPHILSRLTQNQNKIKQLNQKLQQIRVQKTKTFHNPYVNDLQSKEQAMKNKQIQYFGLINRFNQHLQQPRQYSREYDVQVQNKKEKDRLRLEAEQYKRLQLLIQENQYLSKKVLSAKSKSSIQNQEMINVENRIEALRHYRLENGQPYSTIKKEYPKNINYLDISYIPKAFQDKSSRPDEYRQYEGNNHSQQTIRSPERPMRLNIPVAMLSSPMGCHVNDRFIGTSKIF